MKLPKNFLQKIQDFQNVYDREVFSRNKIQIIWSTHHMISRILNIKFLRICKPEWIGNWEFVKPCDELHNYLKMINLSMYHQDNT